LPHSRQRNSYRHSGMSYSHSSSRATSQIKAPQKTKTSFPEEKEKRYEMLKMRHPESHVPPVPGES
jgi:hypothetical protein